jgi:DNA mismatch repair protein MutL
LREQTQAARDVDPPPPPTPPPSTPGLRYAVPPGAERDNPNLYARPAVPTEPTLPAIPAPAAPGYFANLRYLGQVDLTYLACDGNGELVLVDQHAAHERVELARLRAGHADGQLPRARVQNLLFPITFDATPAERAVATQLADLLADVGFVVEVGDDGLAVRAVPAGIRHGDPTLLLRALLQRWADDGAPSEAERLEHVLGEIACHSVVRAGDRLTASEAEALLRSLDGVDLSLSAPHGKAVLLRLPLSEIGRRFGRSDR